MAEEKPVHEQVQELLDRWNKPEESGGVVRAIGETPPAGDTRATAAINPPMPEGDSAFSDDADDRWMYGEELEDLDKAGLVDQAERRGLSTGGTKADLMDRINDHDDADGDEDDDDE